MTWYVSAQGIPSRPYDTEDEANAAAGRIRIKIPLVVVWEIEEESE